MVSLECEEAVEELNEIFSFVDGMIEKFHRASPLSEPGPSKREVVFILNDRLTRAEVVYQQLCIGVRDLSKMHAFKYKESIPIFKRRIEEYRLQLHTLQEFDPPRETETYKGLLKQGAETQSQSLDILRRALQTANETVAVGQQITEELAAQRDQLNRISKNVDKVEAHISIADKLIRVMRRRF